MAFRQVEWLARRIILSIFYRLPCRAVSVLFDRNLLVTPPAERSHIVHLER